MTQLLFLNRSYWPDSEATGQLLTDLCEHLAMKFDVHVVCGQPNSASDDDFIQNGIQQRNGVTIHRLSHFSFAKRVPAGRVLNLISFTHAASRYLAKTKLTPDTIVSETDPFLLPIVASTFAKRTGAKLVCYLQDIYPDVAEAIGKAKPGMVTRQIRKRLRASYTAADKIIVLGECMKRRLTDAPWSLNAAKIEIIPNWANCEKIKPIPHDQNQFRKTHKLNDKFVVMHSGNMGLTQRLDVLIEATMHPQWPDNAVLLLVGDGAAKEKLQQQAASLHPSTPDLQSAPKKTEPTALAAGSDDAIIPSQTSPVHFLPYQPRKELAQSLSAGDLHIVSMHENITGCLCPSKLYGIMAAGRPVLAIAAETTDLCETVQRHDVGWCCPPGDSETIAKAVAIAANDPNTRLSSGQRARAVACSTYDRTVVMNQFQSLLQELSSASTASTPSPELTTQC